MQMTQRTFSNDAYNWNGHYNVNRDYTTNALNQYTVTGTLTPTYDVKGNLTSAGSTIYTYNSKNQLVQASDTGKQFYFDPAGRLDTILSSTGSALAAFQYDGANIATEVNPAATNAVTRRYVWGPAADEALVWYEGPGTTADRRYLVADERGSVVAVTDSLGNMLAINSYDEYGIPGSSNLGRFQYTGQAWLPELGMYDFKARTYSPTLGRFLQTDPIGYGDGINWYNYGGGDPVNQTDPSGLTTGSNYDQGPGLCSSCAGFSTTGGVIAATGEKGDREKGSNAQSLAGLIGTFVRLVFFDSAGNILGTTPWGFRPEPLFQNFDAGGLGGSFGAAASAGNESGDIVVNGTRHRFVIPFLSPCPAPVVFAYFKQAGHSAPGAPATHEGFTQRIVLTGGNPISQYVNSSTGTIINTTLPGHRYYPGSITIQVTPLSKETSTLVITGVGTGAHAEENNFLGRGWFGFTGAGAAAPERCGK
jgi:RHS repeat-associated protein